MSERVTSVLLLDDDRALLEVYTRIIIRAGYRCVTSTNGEEALARIDGEAFDAILTDLRMPTMPGLDFIRRARERDPDLPILIVTGTPGFDSAVKSIDFGVFRYLTKPVTPAELIRSIGDAVHARALALARRAAYSHALQERARPPTPSLLSRALERVALAVQPIVMPASRRVFAYEALLRTSDPILRQPEEVVHAAEQLGQLSSVGRAVRGAAAELMPRLPPGTLLFVNVHPHDLLDPDLFAEDSTLRPHADRVVLELTERSSLEDVPDARVRVAELKTLGYRIALDDMGAGYAGLNSFAVLHPSFVKIDLSMVRNIDVDPVRQALVRSLGSMSRELGLAVIAEGVETSRESRVLGELGCELMQGYRFARPGPPFPEIVW